MATTNEIKKNEEMNVPDQEAIEITITELGDDKADTIESVLEGNNIDDIPTDEPMDAEFAEAEFDDDIDIVCKMLNDAKRERNNQSEQKKRNEEMRRQRKAADEMAAKKAKSEKERQAEEFRRISENRHIRKKMKRRATTMLFCLCIMSAVFGYVVTGIMIHILFDPKVWIFVDTMGIFGMVNTLIHTYMYRYIREEVYRK